MTKSLRKAVNEMCKDCIYDNCTAGTWRQQVDACPSTQCKLYPHRPSPIAGNTRKVPENASKQVDSDLGNANPQVGSIDPNLTPNPNDFTPKLTSEPVNDRKVVAAGAPEKTSGGGNG